MYGEVKVEAENISEAIRIAKDEDGVLPLPDDKSYLDSSWQVNCAKDDIALIECMNPDMDDTDRELLAKECSA
jgi:hypothetical protein